MVDNASDDGTVDFLRGWDGPPFELAAMSSNRGYATAVNAAFERMPGRDVLLLNPDVDPGGPEAAVTLAAFLRSHERFGVAAPRLLHPDGEIQPSARRFPSAATMVATLPGLRGSKPARRRYERYVEPSARRVADAVDWVIGAAMMIRREAFDCVGGWDERFFLYMEDADFCRRCAKAGWKVGYVPDAVMRHSYARASSRPGQGVLSSSARRRHVTSLARFWAKHPETLAGDG